MTYNELLLTHCVMYKNEISCLPDLPECPKINLQTELLLNWEWVGWGAVSQGECLCILNTSRAMYQLNRSFQSPSSGHGLPITLQTFPCMSVDFKETFFIYTEKTFN